MIHRFGKVVDMLEKLHDKFEDERTDLEKEESNARHAYEMLIQDLTAQVPLPATHRPGVALGYGGCSAMGFGRATAFESHGIPWA